MTRSNTFDHEGAFRSAFMSAESLGHASKAHQRVALDLIQVGRFVDAFDARIFFEFGAVNCRPEILYLASG